MSYPLDRARLSLDGLSVGDAFGERFFVAPPMLDRLIADRAIPSAPWKWTDDTAMAIAVVEVLRRRGTIDQAELAREFAQNYGREPDRGYGRGAHEILSDLRTGTPWRDAAGAVFGGKGSLGNGSAMRVAPLGAFFAEAPPGLIAEQAKLSAEVTHLHPEGVAGAIAIALAAAWAAQPRKESGLIAFALEHTPESEVRRGMSRALELPLTSTVAEAVAALGNGRDVTAMDTVPFSLWCAARHLGDYPEALWTTVSGLGDRDTTCAIVGGVVALSAGRDSIPLDWLRMREPLSGG